MHHLRDELTRLGAISLGLFLCSSAPSARAARPDTTSEDRSSSELFDGTSIPRLRIEIPPAGIEVLQQYAFSRDGDGPLRSNVLATVREGKLTYTNVAIHLKGAMGSFRTLDDKPALTLNFDKHAKGQRFHGLQKISLNNSVQDPSFVSEALCREIFLAAGIPSPRAGHATVELNGRKLGLFVLVEGWNRQFLKRHFHNTKGNLWDGGFVRDITARLDTNSGGDPQDRAPLDALAAATRIPDLTNRLDAMGRVLDLDQFITFVGLEVMLAHWDGYAQNRNNYRIFHDLDSGKLIFLPHGLDQMFGVWRTRPESTITPPMRGLVARAVLQTPEGRRRFLSRMAQLSTNLFNVERLTNRVNELSARIQPALMANRQEQFRQQRGVEMLLDRIQRLVVSVRDQLDELTAPLKFDPAGIAHLNRWESKTDKGNPSFNRAQVPLDILQITAGGGASYGSWRTSVLLEPGDYRFEGRAKGKDLVFNPAVTNGGITLRISGERAATMYRPVEDWKTIRYDFTVLGLEDVELVCELRASTGWAWFDVGSLRLVRRRK